MMMVRLIPLGFLGTITGLVVYMSGNDEHPITLVFALVVVLWAVGESWSQSLNVFSVGNASSVKLGSHPEEPYDPLV